MSIGLHSLEITAPGIRAGDISPVAAGGQLDRAGVTDGTIAAYALVTADVAMAQVKEEGEIAAGRYRGPLHGVPVEVKDLFWTDGVPTAGGMAVYKDDCRAENATVGTEA